MRSINHQAHRMQALGRQVKRVPLGHLSSVPARLAEVLVSTGTVDAALRAGGPQVCPHLATGLYGCTDCVARRTAGLQGWTRTSQCRSPHVQVVTDVVHILEGLTSANGVPGAVLEQSHCAAAASAISSCIRAATQRNAPESAAVRQLQAALPHATRLAAALRQWWSSAEQRQESALMLAQVAAGRSCAFLRCANLAGAGGPAMKQGVGSRPCRCEMGVDCAQDSAGLISSWKCSRHRTHGSMHLQLTHAAPLTSCFACLLLPIEADATLCGTAAPPARMPTGRRAATGAHAARWALHVLQPRQRSRRRRRPAPQ